MQNPGKHTAQIRFLNAIADIDPLCWNVLAKKAGPFLQHEFLLALESSGSVCSRTGWQAHHLLLENEEDDLLVAMPLYLKSHSYGEYVFDWSWADAYRTHGLNYYPKLLTAVPFTPSTGPRLLFAEGVDSGEMTATIVQAISKLALEQKISSWHVLFPPTELSEQLRQAGMLQRRATQFQWFNRGYATFEDFLGQLNSRKRKNLKKERKAVAEQGISFRHLAGNEITEELWDQFYLFYQSTYHVRGQQGYLSREFFSKVGRSMQDNLVLVIASKNETCIAGALSFRDETTLYGRYWGSLQEFDFLHFETCYYQGIDYCIEHKLQRFDSGAQGEHKIQRGFEPVTTWSNHWIADPRFREAIADFLSQEAGYVESYKNSAATLLPFRKPG
ncbi:MAG: GNAT family N-acetyltransferase [Pseudomonadales bacterium]|nr:GNAT family N-acetyltransferase [Pseudomonadales bacterium]